LSIPEGGGEGKQQRREGKSRKYMSSGKFDRESISMEMLDIR
jgi:hypothetical protein